MGESSDECQKEKKKEREATLKHFIRFIKEETGLVNVPLFSKNAIV